MAEANQMEIVAASADVIVATVLALRDDSGEARRHAARALATVDPAECGLVAARARRALGVAALADAATCKRSPSSAGSSMMTARRCTITPNTLGWRTLPPPRSAPTGGWKDATSSSTHSAASTEVPLSGSGCSSPAHAASSPARTRPEPISMKRSPTPRGPVAIRAGPARLDYAEWLRRRRRINDAKPVLKKPWEPSGN